MKRRGSRKGTHKKRKRTMRSVRIRRLPVLINVGRLRAKRGKGFFGDLLGAVGTAGSHMLPMGVGNIARAALPVLTSKIPF